MISPRRLSHVHVSDAEERDGRGPIASYLKTRNTRPVDQLSRGVHSRHGACRTARPLQSRVIFQLTFALSPARLSRHATRASADMQTPGAGARAAAGNSRPNIARKYRAQDSATPAPPFRADPRGVLVNTSRSAAALCAIRRADALRIRLLRVETSLFRGAEPG
jgi:hypothetical protein